MCCFFFSVFNFRKKIAKALSSSYLSHFLSLSMYGSLQNTLHPWKSYYEHFIFKHVISNKQYNIFHTATSLFCFNRRSPTAQAASVLHAAKDELIPDILASNSQV